MMARWPYYSAEAAVSNLHPPPQYRLVGMARRSLGQTDGGAKREGQGARDRKKGTCLAVVKVKRRVRLGKSASM